MSDKLTPEEYEALMTLFAFAGAIGQAQPTSPTAYEDARVVLDRLKPDPPPPSIRDLTASFLADPCEATRLPLWDALHAARGTAYITTSVHNQTILIRALPLEKSGHKAIAIA